MQVCDYEQIGSFSVEVASSNSDHEATKLKPQVDQVSLCFRSALVEIVSGFLRNLPL